MTIFFVLIVFHSPNPAISASVKCCEIKVGKRDRVGVNLLGARHLLFLGISLRERIAFVHHLFFSLSVYHHFGTLLLIVRKKESRLSSLSLS